MRDTMIGSLSSMVVSTPQDVYQVVGALQLAAAKPEEITQESQVQLLQDIDLVTKSQ